MPIGLSCLPLGHKAVSRFSFVCLVGWLLVCLSALLLYISCIASFFEGDCGSKGATTKNTEKKSIENIHEHFHRIAYLAFFVSSWYQNPSRHF